MHVQGRLRLQCNIHSGLRQDSAFLQGQVEILDEVRCNQRHFDGGEMLTETEMRPGPETQYALRGMPGAPGMKRSGRNALGSAKNRGS